MFVPMMSSVMSLPKVKKTNKQEMLGDHMSNISTAGDQVEGKHRVSTNTAVTLFRGWLFSIIFFMLDLNMGTQANVWDHCSTGDH